MWGFASKLQYFDCELDVAKGNTLSKAVAAFMPYNKNPKTPFTAVVMGIRQITTFLALFPRWAIHLNSILNWRFHHDKKSFIGLKNAACMHRGHSRLRTQSENWKYLLEVVNRSALVSATIVDSFISMDEDLSEIVEILEENSTQEENAHL